MKSVVVPLSFDDVDFNRLFQDVTKNALFQDVMIDMDIKNQLKARVKKMVFTRVDKTANKPTSTPRGIHSPFTPTKTTQAQMDDMAQQMWAACEHSEYIKSLFSGIEDLKPEGGSLTQTFVRKYFSTFKLVPDLAANISKMNGVPLCVMTGDTYTAASGLSGEIRRREFDRFESGVTVRVPKHFGRHFQRASHGFVRRKERKGG